MNPILQASAENTSSTYYVSQNTGCISRRILSACDVSSIKDQDIAVCSAQVRSMISRLLSDALPDLIIEYMSEDEINSKLTEQFLNAQRGNPELEPLVLDRYLTIETGSQVMQLELTRLNNGVKANRPGSPTMSEQLRQIKEASKEKPLCLH